MFGGVAAQEIMRLFFSDEAKQYFSDIACKCVYEHRMRLTPSSLLKPYLGSIRTAYYEEVLNELEVLSPSFDNYLVNSFRDVIASNLPRWVLYTEDTPQVQRCSINFFGPTPLILEMQEYLRHKAEKHVIAGNSFVLLLYDKWKSLKNPLKSCSMSSLLTLTLFWT